MTISSGMLFHSREVFGMKDSWYLVVLVLGIMKLLYNSLKKKRIGAGFYLSMLYGVSVSVIGAKLGELNCSMAIHVGVCVHCDLINPMN